RRSGGPRRTGTACCSPTAVRYGKRDTAFSVFAQRFGNQIEQLLASTRVKMHGIAEVRARKGRRCVEVNKRSILRVGNSLYAAHVRVEGIISNERTIEIGNRHGYEHDVHTARPGYLESVREKLELADKGVPFHLPVATPVLA